MYSSTLPMVKPGIIYILKRCYCQEVRSSFHDIVISGGGMIGQTMAVALGKSPQFRHRSILLIESSPKKNYQTPELYSNRVSSIVPGTKNLFVKLNMWPNISRYQEVKDMIVWGSYSKDYVHFFHDAEKPAYIIENDEIIHSAVVENTKASNVTISYGKTINNVKLDPYKSKHLHEIVLNDGTSIKTNLLIGADGAKSSVRDAMNVVYSKWQYGQFGIVATLSLPDELDNSTAYQKFLPTGPIAILPLRKGLSSLVWSVTERKAKDLIKLPDEVFVDVLNEALNSDPLKNNFVDYINDCSKGLIGGNSTEVVPLIPPFVLSQVSGSRAMFPLSFGFSDIYVRGGVALIGDAAHKVHPLAGQGVNMGFRDVRLLVERLVEGARDGRPLGHLRDLSQYETEAQRANLPLIAAIEAFHRLYTGQSDLLQAIGSTCIRLAATVPLVKNFMRNVATN